MKCPHCLENFHEDWTRVGLGGDIGHIMWSVSHCKCPACKRIIMSVEGVKEDFSSYERMVYPKAISRVSLPEEVDDVSVVNDYSEACAVLSDSAKASAALSRRSLQHILRDKVGVKPSDLYSEIQQVLDNNLLPSDLAENLDAIRNIGNFAAHPIKSTSTGEVVDVEPGEAEWNLEVLEDLIDYAYVRPARSQARKDALNKKLKDAGKPEIK